MLILTVLEVIHLKSRCQQDWLLPEALRKNVFHVPPCSLGIEPLLIDLTFSYKQWETRLHLHPLPEKSLSYIPGLITYIQQQNTQLSFLALYYKDPILFSLQKHAPHLILWLTRSSFSKRVLPKMIDSCSPFPLSLSHHPFPMSLSLSYTSKFLQPLFISQNPKPLLLQF